MLKRLILLLLLVALPLTACAADEAVDGYRQISPEEAQALLDSDNAALEMAQENYRVASLNYQAGVNTVTDVLEANALLLQAQNAITDREISYVSARRRYHDLTGK